MIGWSVEGTLPHEIAAGAVTLTGATVMVSICAEAWTSH